MLQRVVLPTTWVQSKDRNVHLPDQNSVYTGSKQSSGPWHDAGLPEESEWHVVVLPGPLFRPERWQHSAGKPE